MSENVAERRNLFPNPRFMPDGRREWKSGDCTLTYHGGGALTMSPLSGASLGGWCDFVLPMQPGDYVASVNFDFVSGDNDFRGNMLSASVTDANNNLEGAMLNELTDFTSGRRDLRFTVPAGASYVRLRFRGSKSRDVTLWNPQVELASTYDTAVAAGGGYTRCCSTGVRSRSKRSGVVA